LATGPWLPEFAGDVKVAPGRGWLIRTDRLRFEVPWIIEEISWPDQEELGRGVRYPTMGDVARGRYNQPAAEAFVVAPQPGGEALVGASLAPSLLECPDRLGVPEEMARRVLELAPGFEQVSVRAAWYAHRPMSLDGLPITGPVAGTDGLFVHAAHGSLGMQAAPATARWLAARMAGLLEHPGLDWLDPARESLTV
jgi:glycine/D-amino acid oxidase-like deaminating enzyme